MNIEKIAEVAMNVITYSGLAKSCYIEAIREMRAGNYEGFNESITKGDESFVKAHHAHIEILNREMSTGEPQITMLLAHAEDQLMSAETIKTLVVEMALIIEEMRGNKNV